jgi:hypothetical protein
LKGRVLPITGAEKAHFLALHSEGKNPFEIERVTKRSHTAIAKYLRSRGVTPHYKSKKRTADARLPKAAPLACESYAVCADGGSLTVSHGISADAAERTLDALTRGRDVVRRGTARIGEWKRAGDVASDVVAGIAAKRTAIMEAAEEYRRERAASEKLAKEGTNE